MSGYVWGACGVCGCAQHRCTWLYMGVRKYAQVHTGVWMGMCVWGGIWYAWVCMGMCGSVWDEFSEYILELES